MSTTWNEKRYFAARRRYRRRMLPAIVAGGLVFVSIYSTAAYHFDTKLWWWGAGLVTGSVLGIAGALAEIAPEHIRRRQRGVAGERKTKKALNRLEREGWSVRHGIDVGRGDIDHLVLGPHGAYIIETKALLGTVTVERGLLTTRQADDPDEISRWRRLAPRLTALGKEVSAWIRQDTGRRSWVHPVVVIWGDFPQGEVEANRIVYLHGDRLVSWLRARPPRDTGIDFDGA